MRRALFYFDFISHNAYLAWSRLASLSDRHDVAFELVPVVFGVLLKAYGQMGPAEVPPKSWWMLRDVVRKARLAGVPLVPPHSHPFNPLLPLRVASLPMSDEERARLVAALFSATWAQGRDVSDADVVEAVVSEAGFDGAELVARAGADEAKARLRAQTDSALERGVFGVPSLLVDDTLFFGFDDLPNFELHLRGEDPLAEMDLGAWRAVRPSVQRNR